VEAGPLCRAHRLHLQLDSNASRSLLLKVAPLDDESSRQLAAASKCFEREVGFFKAVRTEPTPLGLPRALFAACDARGGAALLLTDPSGGEGVPALARVDGCEALAAGSAASLVRALAQHHARYWQSPVLELWKSWLPPVDAPLIADYEPALCEAALDDALRRFGDELPTELRAALPGLPAATRGQEGILAHLASRPRTLLHGRVRAESLYLPAALLEEEGGEASAGEVHLTDWGNCVIGRGSLDVASLLAMMEPEARSEAEHNLLGEYHDELQESGVTAYSMYDAWEDYRHGMAYALLGAVSEAGAPGLEADAAAWGAARRRLLRVAEAASDLGCASLFPR
jgi:hypothetical protein